MKRRGSHRTPLFCVVISTSTTYSREPTLALEARETLRELAAVCTAGGFSLKKWAANDVSLLQDIPGEDLAQPDPRAWFAEHSHSTLGLQWLPNADAFAFAVQPNEEEPITKRTVLSQAARFFDPMGWLAPTTIQAKILIQSAWLQGRDWDNTLSEADGATWRRLWSELPLLATLRIPRWLRWSMTEPPLNIHGFADASERAYAAVVYLRTEGRDGVNVTLISAVHRRKLPPEVAAHDSVDEE